MMDCLCPAPRALACRVVLLDERDLLHEMQDNSTGQALLDVVFRHLDLLETAYFGLRYVDQDNQTHWLDAGRKLRRQLRGSDSHTFYFGVKFYAADPCKLLEEITRYQLFLQLKQDVLRGRLPVGFDLAAELAAYVLQSELGDYDPRRHGPGYVSEFRLLAHQTPELEARAVEIHRTLTGISPAQAELSYLDKVKWLDMYGVDLHPVLGEDSVEYFLGLAPSGLLLLRGKHTVANYYWPRVSKLYYRGRYFMLRVADKNNETLTYGFESPTRAACRHLWRCCSDHHAFFRLQQTSPASADMFALGSRLRNSGKVSRPRPPPAFTRTPSRRISRPPSAYSSLLDVPKLEDLRIKDCPPEVKQPTSVNRPNSISGEGLVYEAGCAAGGGGGSPRSTRSAPARRGLYAASPSATRPPPAPRHRSASVDSQSSNDSRSNRKHRHRSRRQQSDAESELSRGSGRSGRSGRRHRRHRSRHKLDSGSERDDSQPDTKEYELVDSESQWKEVLRQTTAGSGVQVASVRRSQMEPETGTHRSSHRPRRHRKHRSRSGSPNEKKWLPTELKQHLEFSLVDTAGMTEEQLKEIPYTVVQTSHARQTKLRTSSKHRQGEHGSLSRREKNSGSLVKSNQDIHNQGSLRSSSSTLSTHKNNDKHGRRAYSGYEEQLLRSGEDFLHNGYKGPPTPVSSNNNPYSPVTNSNSNSSSGELISGSARVSHEHTDSGLGADQDYAYSSERSSDSAKCGAGGSGGTVPVSRQWTLGTGAGCAGYAGRAGAGAGAGLARRPPAAPRTRMSASGSQRSLLSVASDSATSRRARDLTQRYPHPADSGFSLFRHASNNNIMVGESGSLARRYARPSRESRDGRDCNANVPRTHARLAHHAHAHHAHHAHVRHDNTLDIILKPLIESTQLQST
ncbi:band 4.1-like protein 4 isoform X1 [Papilio machaon]|uniref:band 4.1-like protein 4 isoform X1 n=1 Tax=Papilio machaon TaxID=76193 RepID=UPI001E663BD4|nr:band 4.1-like protein 4 isoform X1 [Papilio machaon]